MGKMFVVLPLILLGLVGCGSEEPVLIPVDPIPPGRLVRELHLDHNLDGTTDTRILVEYSEDNKPLAFAYDIGNNGTVDFTRGADWLPPAGEVSPKADRGVYFPLLPQGPFEPTTVELDQDLNGIPDLRISYFYVTQPVPVAPGEVPLEGNPVPR
jgi:hypothetical protein